jgi:serine/threonine protein kinase
MSPERARGTGNDPRSDLYAIGVMAFELIVGLPPFMGTPDEVIRGHLKEKPVPASSRRDLGDVPPELDALILKAMAKKPDERFQNAADLFAALTKVPGYPNPKTETRRRFVPVTRRPASLESDTPQGFDNVRGALRQVAEALIDLGINDTQLVSRVAQLRDREQSLAGVEAAQDALEHEAVGLRETIGDRETSLRFALGELPYTAHSPTHRRASRRKFASSRRASPLRRPTASACARSRAGSPRSRASAEARSSRWSSPTTSSKRIVETILPEHAQDPVVEPLAQRLALFKRR